MKRLVFVLTATVFSLFSQAQNKTLKEVLTLKMPLTADDDMCGTRGANVVWHPVQKKYYAAFAGNAGYPLAIFDAKGTRLSADISVCLQDVRGLWYNPDTNAIQGNTYDENGWFSYELDATGNIKDYTTIFEGMNQPDGQSVGAFNYKDKKVLFAYDGKLHIYDVEDATPSSTTDINYGKSKSSSSGGDLASTNTNDYNYTSLIYTGIAGAEIGLLNLTNKEIELYDLATCHLARILTLPDTATTESSFNFAYANGIYWIFDMEGRVWHGYK